MKITKITFGKLLNSPSITDNIFKRGYISFFDGLAPSKNEISAGEAQQEKYQQEITVGRVRNYVKMTSFDIIIEKCKMVIKFHRNMFCKHQVLINCNYRSDLFRRINNSYKTSLKQTSRCDQMYISETR